MNYLSPLWLSEKLIKLNELDRATIIKNLTDSWAKDLGLREQDPLEDLILEMLKIKPQERITAQKALEKFKQIPALTQEEAKLIIPREKTALDLLGTKIAQQDVAAEAVRIKSIVLASPELINTCLKKSRRGKREKES